MRFLLHMTIVLTLWACPQISPFTHEMLHKKADIGIAHADDVSYWANSTRAYPLMSVFKLHIATAIMDKVNRDELALNQIIKISAGELDANTWSPMLKKYPQTGFNIKLRELLYYMLAESDNNACDILIERVGGISALQEYVRHIGLKNTTIKVTENNMQTNKMLQYQNTATLHDVILLLKKINNNELFAPKLHEELIEIMCQTNTGANKIKKYLPQMARVAHKTGSSSRLNGKKIADNDVAIIKYDNKTYYLAVLVADSSETDDTNAETIAAISKAVYKTYVNK